jgi:hypothetical protein
VKISAEIRILPLLREPPKLLGKTGSATHGLRASIKS